MNLISRRRILHGLGLASMGVVATTRGPRTAMAASSWADTSLTYKSSDGTFPALTITETSINFEFGWSNFSSGTSTIALELSARLEDSESAYESVITGEFSVDGETGTTRVTGKSGVDNSTPILVNGSSTFSRDVLSKTSLNASDFEPSGDSTKRTTPVEFQLNLTYGGDTITRTSTATITVTNPIPDSVVMQHTGETFETGDGTWTDEASGHDVALNGDLQASTLSDGAAAIQSDGTDDYGRLQVPSEFEGTGLQNASVELALEYSGTDVYYPFGVFNDSNYPNLILQLNRDYASNSDPGNFRFGVDAGDASRLRFGPSNNPGLNDGERHDISLIIHDSTTSDVSIIIDGAEVATSIEETDNPSDWGAWDKEMAFFATNTSDGTKSAYLPGKLGISRWHNTAITEQTISDY